MEKKIEMETCKICKFNPCVCDIEVLKKKLLNLSKFLGRLGIGYDISNGKYNGLSVSETILDEWLDGKNPNLNSIDFGITLSSKMIQRQNS